MSLGIDAKRLAIDRVYLDECTVKAYQERARLKNKRDAMGEVLSSINRSIAELDEWLLTLEHFHREHAHEFVPTEVDFTGAMAVKLTTKEWTLNSK